MPDTLQRSPFAALSRPTLAHAAPGLVILAVLLLTGCESEESPLAPYTERGVLSSISVEQDVFVPKVTWLGGYVCAFGVNRGTEAKLDSTLIALYYQPGDNVRYPVTVGSVPAGAQDLASAYGGIPATALAEDNQYTFWVMKEEVWGQVSAQRNKTLVVDSTASALVTLRGDTVFVSPAGLAVNYQSIDIYINIRDVRAFGRLARLDVLDSKTSSAPLIRWTITQPGVTDSAVAAIGITNGSQYDVNMRYWEMISEDLSVTPPVYFKNNVIPQPLSMGQSVPSTRTFVAYPAVGLERGKGYYLWIAGKDWDGVNRTRSTAYYAFATFTVW
jgi:hypothetical protein